MPNLPPSPTPAPSPDRLERSSRTVRPRVRAGPVAPQPPPRGGRHRRRPLVLSGCLYGPGNPGAADVTLTVDVSQDVHAISPLIYGLNGADAATLAGTRATILRMGGNRWTAYNWENNASNAGSDWCFQNDGLLSSSNVPGAAVQPTITQARNAGAAALVTVPIVDYVAADKNGGCDVRNSGPNYLQTRFRQNLSTKPGALSTTPDATDGFVYEDEYVNWLKQTERRRQHASSTSTTSPTCGPPPTPRSTPTRSPTPNWPAAPSTTPRPSSGRGPPPRSSGR